MAKADLFSTTTAVPVALPPEQRKRIGDEIERLIGVLDATDGDPDLEDNGDAEPDNDGEASLGWSAGMNQDRALKQCRDGSAGVFGPDREEDRADFEPSLGWTLDGARGGSDDREDAQCEGE